MGMDEEHRFGEMVGLPEVIGVLGEAIGIDPAFGIDVQDRFVLIGAGAAVVFVEPDDEVALVDAAIATGRTIDSSRLPERGLVLPLLMAGALVVFRLQILDVAVVPTA